MYNRKECDAVTFRFLKRNPAGANLTPTLSSLASPQLLADPETSLRHFWSQPAQESCPKNFELTSYFSPQPNISSSKSTNLFKVFSSEKDKATNKRKEVNSSNCQLKSTPSACGSIELAPSSQRQDHLVFPLDPQTQKSDLCLISAKTLNEALLDPQLVLNMSTRGCPQQDRLSTFESFRFPEANAFANQEDYKQAYIPRSLITSVSDSEHLIAHNSIYDTTAYQSCSEPGSQGFLSVQRSKSEHGLNFQSTDDENVASSYPVEKSDVYLRVHHKLIIIDCRYYYEYAGGHIGSAINISSPVAMKLLFGELREQLFDSSFVDGLLTLAGRNITSQDLTELTKRVRQGRKNKLNTGGREARSQSCVPVIIFHCEFSSQRGPNMWRLARKLDRHANAQSYPKLDFPQLFVVKGGYEGFVSSHRESCEPAGAYRSMFCPESRLTLRDEESRHTEQWRLAKM